VNGGDLELPPRKQIPQDCSPGADGRVANVQIFVNVKDRDFTGWTVVQNLLSKPAHVVGEAAIYDVDAGTIRVIGGGNRGTAWMPEQPLRENS